MILDVGCGTEPRGDVNCDLFVEDVYFHRGIGHHAAFNILPVHDIPNFVQCDSQHLPFKDDAFDEVFSAQVIEHVQHPFLMFHELVRVSKKSVVLETMHRLGEAFSGQKSREASRWFKEHHVNKFNIRSLNAYGLACDCRVIENYTLYFFYFPHEYFCLFKFPSEIGLRFEKLPPKVLNTHFCGVHQQVYSVDECPMCVKEGL